MSTLPTSWFFDSLAKRLRETEHLLFETRPVAVVDVSTAMVRFFFVFFGVQRRRLHRPYPRIHHPFVAVSPMVGTFVLSNILYRSHCDDRKNLGRQQ